MQGGLERQELDSKKSVLRLMWCGWEVVQFVSWSCWNKLPQTGRLRRTLRCCLTVLEVGSRKSRYQQGHSPAWGFRGGVFLASFSYWCLQHALACGYVIPHVKANIFKPLSVVFTSPPPLWIIRQISLCLPFIGTHVIALSAHPDNPT